MERDLSRNCVHIDMDAFFASVEMRDDQRLRNVPMAVGSESMLVDLLVFFRFFFYLVHYGSVYGICESVE